MLARISSRETILSPSWPGKSAKRVFALDVPAIHVFLVTSTKTWMPGTSPGMTTSWALYLLPGSEIIRLATSLFQMNSTSSAPMVAVMKPAP